MLCLAVRSAPGVRRRKCLCTWGFNFISPRQAHRAQESGLGGAVGVGREGPGRGEWSGRMVEVGAEMWGARVEMVGEALASMERAWRAADAARRPARLIRASLRRERGVTA